MINDFSDFAKRLTGNYRTVNLCVLYFLPDYSNIIQEFYWQTDDTIPELYRIHKFLNHWHNNIEADIHQVKISCSEPLKATTFNHIKYDFPIFWSYNPNDIKLI